jgi:hypothetical protein
MAMVSKKKPKQTIAWAVYNDSGKLATMHGERRSFYMVFTHKDFFETEEIIPEKVRKVIITEVE